MKLIVATVALLCLGAANAECPNGCSQHGKCNLYSACECYRNWMGADCSERVCYFGHAFIDTAQGDINSDGQLAGADGVAYTTYETQYTNAQTWELYDLTSHGKGAQAMGSFGYGAAGLPSGAVGVTSVEANKAFAPVMQVHSGADDDQPTLWDEAHFYRECSNKGICNRQTGQCACFKGYEGEGCTRTACANDCSGHGVCERLKDSDSLYEAWDAYKTQQCVCDAGYMGPDCSLRKCPQGDDPVSRVQNTEVQAFGFTPYGDATTPNTGTDASGVGLIFGLAESFYGRFALKFTDEFGDSWTTSTLSWPSGPFNKDGMCNGSSVNSNGGAAKALTKGDKIQRHKTTLDDGAAAKNNDISYCSISTTTEIENALKALPNDVVPDVSVSFHFVNSLNAAQTDGVSPTPAPINSGWAYKVTFSGNSGDVNPLEVLYEVTQCTGTDSCNVNKGTAIRYSSQGTAEAPTLESARVASLTFGADASAPAGTTLEEGAASGIVVNGGCRSATACDVRVTSGTFAGSGSVSNVKVQGTPSWPFDGTKAEPRVAVAATAAAHYNLMTSTGFPFASTAASVVKLGFGGTGTGSAAHTANAGSDGIIGGTAGTTENTVCSNRGLCDYTTGLCKCFAGYTKGDCSSQNSLAMN